MAFNPIPIALSGKAERAVEDFGEEIARGAGMIGERFLKLGKVGAGLPFELLQFAHDGVRSCLHRINACFDSR